MSESDDVFSVTEIEIDRNIMASNERAPGVIGRCMIQEKYRELVRPKRPHTKVMEAVANPKEGAVIGYSLGVRPGIVLRDGCAVHMGKDLAG